MTSRYASASAPPNRHSDRGRVCSKSPDRLASALVCGVLGLLVPVLIDRDVSGAVASGVWGFLGLIVGAVLGAIIVRRSFD